jgi:hypothetical protein
MKVNEIKDLIKVAFEAREICKKNPSEKDTVYNLVGDAGIGKTYGLHLAAEECGAIVRTLIVSQLDQNDFVGLLYKREVNGVTVSDYALPAFWPQDGKGILFLDEISKGKEEVRAPLLQLLNERRLHDYILPPDWIVVAAMNPDNDFYDVSSFDTALKRRLTPRQVHFDLATFVEYAKKAKFHEDVIRYLESGLWTYFKPEQISSDASATYICPSMWHEMSTTMKTKAFQALDILSQRSEICDRFGALEGDKFFKFLHEESPVLAKDILENKEAAFKRLKNIKGEGNAVKGGSLSETVKSIVDNYGGENAPEGKIGFSLIMEIAGIVNAHLGVQLVKGCIQSENNDLDVDEFLNRVGTKYPKLIQALKVGNDIESKGTQA